MKEINLFIDCMRLILIDWLTDWFIDLYINFFYSLIHCVLPHLHLWIIKMVLCSSDKFIKQKFYNRCKLKTDKICSKHDQVFLLVLSLSDFVFIEHFVFIEQNVHLLECGISILCPHNIHWNNPLGCWWRVIGWPVDEEHVVLVGAQNMDALT